MHYDSVNSWVITHFAVGISGGGKGRKSSVKALRGCGFADLSEKVYPGMRHEILNETEKSLVYQDVLETLDAWQSK